MWTKATVDSYPCGFHIVEPRPSVITLICPLNLFIYFFLFQIMFSFSLSSLYEICKPPKTEQHPRPAEKNRQHCRRICWYFSWVWPIQNQACLTLFEKNCVKLFSLFQPQDQLLIISLLVMFFTRLNSFEKTCMKETPR